MITDKNITTLGGTASGIKVAKVAHGLMMMTWVRSQPVPDEEAFESIKAGVDALPPDVKMFVNSGEFYANDLGTANLELLARFFDKYPDYAERIFLSVKGGTLPQKITFDASPQNLRRSVENINRALRGTKKLDLFESARVDPNVPVEEATKTLKGLLEEGLFEHIGLSECSAETLRRANTVHPIAVVEIEVSPWSYEEETKKVLATASELGIAVAAYSPLGRGFLTGAIRTLDDIPEGDHRRHFTRFKPENFKHNLEIVDEFIKVAKSKGVTPAQLCIAWVASLGDKVIPMPGSSHKSRTLENLGGGDIELSAQEKAEIERIINEYEVKGDRYAGQDRKTLLLWG
ncbi:NADP-dependent oxidoreductase domain superfamily protein [Abortiporus biennis]